MARGLGKALFPLEIDLLLRLLPELVLSFDAEIICLFWSAEYIVAREWSVEGASSSANAAAARAIAASCGNFIS